MGEQRIGRYEIRAELGHGGMSTVYRALDPASDREVAIKVLPRELLHDPQFRIRFEREIKTVAALEHPAIVPVYDVGEEDGLPYFVMRCMTGGSLEERIAKGPLSLPETARIIAQIAPALGEAHSKGIIHRDLKPGNILFDRNGDAYISDFGIAKITQSETATVTQGAIVGTPAYMSPEQAQGEQVDGRSDVYALGVIVYEMLTGNQPYQATTPMGVAIKQINQPVPHILDTKPELPAEIERVVEKAMAKSAADRFPSVGEFSSALSTVASAVEFTGINKNSATRISRPKPPELAAETIVSQSLKAGKKKAGFPLLAVFVIGLLGICVLGILAAAVFKVCLQAGPSLPWCENGKAGLSVPPIQPTLQLAAAVTQTSVPATASLATAEPTQTALPPSSTPTRLPADTPALPVKISLGGADKVAFVASGEIWLMKIDGSDLHALTNDKTAKTNLQWIPGTDRLVYISGTTVFSLDTVTSQSTSIVSFPFARLLEEFRISPDGKQAAISLNREMYIVPFDLEKLKSVSGRDGLIAMKGCLSYTGSTLAAIHLKAFRWGRDGITAAWLFEGSGQGNRSADLIRVTDISGCDPFKLRTQDEFPGARFTPEGFGRNPVLPSYDWDGNKLFVMNTFDRNDGWGYFYTYSRELHQGQQDNPITSTRSRCCYRDARWSPDGTYIFFAYQNKDILNSPIQFYYVPVESIRSGVSQPPIPLPENFFDDLRTAPQPALHPSQ